MDDFHLRRYELGDADAVWDIHERARRDVGAYHEEYVHLSADLRQIPEVSLDAGGEFLVGELGATVVAMGALQPVGDVDHHDGSDGTGVVRRMRVDPDHQRRGYDSTILDALEARAVDLGFDRLVLDTTPRQEAARALYEGFGYREVERWPTQIGEMILYGYGQDEIRTELEQCILLCANCHRREHATGDAAVVDDKSATVEQYEHAGKPRTRSQLRARSRRYRAREGCRRCSVTDLRCLVFHHRDASRKERGVAAMISDGQSYERVRREATTCTVLCVNCHRKSHYAEPASVRGNDSV